MAGFKVRPIEDNDAGPVWGLAQQFLNDTRYGAHMTLTQERFVADFLVFVDSHHAQGWVCETEDGEIEGVVFATAERLQFSEELSSCDNAIFVKQGRRGAALSKRLLKAYVQWAQDLGIKNEHIQIGVITGVTTERTAQYFERIGFKCVGRMFVWGGSHG